ncbi:recombinase family protein [uncultured Oscillibacter sp.]|uniref:recombinase family protein n=1 Tax=uncultured Oscillibacter sp. TaxID=876091 RepID=UPI00262470D2|nr:recombinase family protein [uncultured Oscillibacter sp.]
MAEQIIQTISDMPSNTIQTVKKRIVCLYRVSTVGQAEKDDIPMQKQYCRELCKQYPGWEIIKEFSEKGVSGFKVSAKDRDAIQEIQKMALQSEFDILLVFMFDRLGRKDNETPFVVEWFVKQNIEVWRAMEGQQRFDSHVDKLLNYIRYWQASGESIMTSLRVKTRIEQLTQDGHYTGGRVPFGYRAERTGRMNKKNQDVRDLVIVPEDAEIVRLIFQKYVYEGYGALRLCNYFREQGIRKKDGGEVTVGMVNRAVRNTIYIGVIHRGESKSEVLPELKIIDEELFLRAQKIASARKVRQREVPLTTRGQSLLVGNVYCGCCGARLMLTTSGHRYRRKDGTEATSIISSYKCYNRTNVPGKCNGQTCFSVEKLDNLVDQIIRIQFDQIQKAPLQALLEKQRCREVDLAKAKVKRLQNEYWKKQRDYQDLRTETLKVIQGNSQFSADLLNSLIDETTAQIEELGQQVQSAEQELRDTVSGAEQVSEEYTQLMNWADLYDNCSFEAKKMIVAQFVKAVHVKRGYEVNIEFNVSFEEFQLLYLEPETPGRKRRNGASEILALAGNV